MADIKWIKITTDIFDDEKILLIESMPDADAIIVIWFKLLVLAGKTNNCGLLTINDTIPYNDEMLATIFRRPIATVRLALNTFQSFGMIDIINDTICIPKWEVHQNIEGMEKIRAQNRERKRRQREREKILMLESGSAESRDNSREVTQQIKNKNKDKEEDKNKSNKSKRFAPPSVEEVAEYINQMNYHINAEQFIDYYESNGWLVGKAHMKDWKATVRNWERRRQNDTKNSKPTNPFLEMLEKGDY